MSYFQHCVSPDTEHSAVIKVDDLAKEELTLVREDLVERAGLLVQLEDLIRVHSHLRHERLRQRLPARPFRNGLLLPLCILLRVLAVRAAPAN